MSLTLITGGTRSGKSARAEALALAAGQPVRYVATADSADASMAERIAAHAARRPAAWVTVQANGSLADALGAEGCVLVDGLGVWLARVMDTDREAVLADVDALIAAAAERTVIVVAEEAGQGVLPMGEVTRAWLDLLGDAVQRLGACAERVEFVVAGRVWSLGPHGGDQRTTPHGDACVRPGDADHAVNVMAGGPPEWLRAALEAALDDVARFTARLREAGIRVWPASANYVLVEVPDGPRVLRALRDERIAVRPAASFPGLGPDHLRITARGPDENARLVAALA